MSDKSSIGAKKWKSSSSSSSRKTKQKQPKLETNDIMDDSDSEDDDDINDLLNTKVFTPHKSKQKRPKLVIGKRYSICNNNNDEKKEGGKQKSDAMTTEEIEAEAKRQVASIDLHLVEKTDSLEELGWWYRKCKQREEYYPVRKCRQDEAAKEYFDEPLKQNYMYIRLLGWKYDSAGDFDQMPKRQWQNFIEDEAVDSTEYKDEETEATKKATVHHHHHHHHHQQQERQSQENNSNNDDNERKLKIFLNLPGNNKKFQDDPVGLKLEELAIKAQWNKVRQLQQEKGQKSSNGQGGEAETDDNDEADGNAKVDMTAMATTAAEIPQLKLSPLTQVSKETNAPTIAEEKKDEEDDASSDDDSDDGDDIDDFLSPGKKRKKEKLRDGDAIEYYDPIGVAGKKEWLKRATILGIQPKGRIPLNLDNGQGLDKHCMIKLVKRRLRGKLVDVNTGRSGGGFKPLREYGLKTCGTTDLVALKEMAQYAKGVRQSHREGVAKLWEEHNSGNCNDNDEGENNNEPDKESAAETTTIDEDKKPLAIISQEEEEEEHDQQEEKEQEQETDPDVKEPAWKNHLEGLLKETTEKKKASKRYKPPMEPEQLELILQVWPKLQQRLDRTGESTIEVVVQLAKVLEISLYRLDAVMHGNVKKQCSTPNKNEVLEVISKWLDTTEASEFINKQGGKVSPPLNIRKRPLQSTPEAKMPASTDKRKRLKQEDTALEVDQDKTRASSSLSLATSQPIHRGEAPGRRSSAVAGRRKRRLTTIVDVGISSKRTTSTTRKSLASILRRRQSCMPAVETVQSKGSYKEAVPTTATKSAKGVSGNKRKAAPTSYVPPSVTVRRKRKSAALSSRSTDSDDHDVMMPTKKKQCMKTVGKDDDDPEKKKAPSPIEHAQSKIQNLIKHEKKNIETKSRRYRPHMTIEQLEFVLKCWDEIGKQVDDPTSDDAVSKYIVDLSQELDEGVSHYKLVRFLQGDSEKKLMEGQIQNVRRILEAWQKAENAGLKIADTEL